MRSLPSLTLAMLIGGVAIASAQPAPPSAGGEKPNTPAASDQAPGQIKPEGSSAKPVAPGQMKSESDGPKQSDGKTDVSKSKKDAKSDGAAHVKSKTEASGGKKTPSASGKEGAKAEVTTEQRNKVKTSFAKHRVEPTSDLNVSIGIGTVVPRKVKLYAIPQDILVIVPRYHAYRYFMIGNQVVIVDPDTYAIVEVIIV